MSRDFGYLIKKYIFLKIIKGKNNENGYEQF